MKKKTDSYTPLAYESSTKEKKKKKTDIKGDAHSDVQYLERDIVARM